MIFNKQLLDDLLRKATASERLRFAVDLRNGADDNSQRMLNAIQPGSVIPIHRHPSTSETMVLLCGVADEVFYNNQGEETDRYTCSVATGILGVQVPAGMWHTLIVKEPTVIIEVKDGAYQFVGVEEVK